MKYLWDLLVCFGVTSGGLLLVLLCSAMLDYKETCRHPKRTLEIIFPERQIACWSAAPLGRAQERLEKLNGHR